MEKQQQKNVFFEQCDQALKQLYFDVVDKHEELKEQYWNLINMSQDKRNADEEKNKIKEILKLEKYYDIVADFAKTWGNVDKCNTEVPEIILGGADLTSKYLQIPLASVLKKEYNPSITQEILEKYRVNEDITDQQVESYQKEISKRGSEKMSEVDRESNWENLSNASEDVIYLNEEEMANFEIEGEDDMYDDNEEGKYDEEEEDEEDESERVKETEDDSIFSLKGHTSFVTRLQLDHSGKYLISGGGDDIAIVWDLEKKELIQKLQPKKETIDSVAFNFDGSLIATATLDGELDIYTFKDNKVTHKCKLDSISEEITFVDWHNKGNAVIAGSIDNTAHLWNGAKGELIHSFFGHEDAINFGCFSPDGTLVLTASADKTVRIWSPKTGQQVHRIGGYGFHEDSINIIAFHKTKPIIATGSEDKTVCISNYQTGKIMGRTNEHGGIVDAVLFTSQMDLFVSGSSDGICRIYDISKISIREKVQLQGSINKIVELPSKFQIIASTNHGRLYMFDYRKPKELYALKGAGETIHDFVVYNDEGCYTACEDGQIRYFDFSKFYLTN